MSGQGNSREEIKDRIKPILDRVAVDGLRAWLKSVNLIGSAYSRADITDLIVKQIFEEKLTEAALEIALIGFEEASDMRIYLFRLEEMPQVAAETWIPARLKAADIPLCATRSFAGDKVKPMSPVYAHLEGGLLRVKWAEQQQRSKINDKGTGLETKPVFKRIVLIVDFLQRTAELRLNPPENGHSYEDGGGRVTAEAYYSAYIDKTRNLLGCELLASELRPVIKRLVQEEPRRVRIHIDNHTDQGNYKSKTTGAKADIRDSSDWQMTYNASGETWAWDAQSFYWLPKVSTGFLAREVFSHIDAETGFVKVNADCSDNEVTYVVSQIRAREEAKS